MNISNINNQYLRLATLKRINKASDDVAGSNIISKLRSQLDSHNISSNNAELSSSMLKVADGGLSSISDSLQRIRELSVQASSSALYTNEDKKAMQQEIDGLKASIQDVAKGTEFNTMKLLDGSKASYDLAVNPKGGTLSIQIMNSTLESLGIEDYDITKDFDMDTIDNAISMVNKGRSDIGANQNALDSISAYNKLAQENLTKSAYNIDGLDIGMEVSNMKKDQVLQQYQMFINARRLQTMNPNFSINEMLGL